MTPPIPNWIRDFRCEHQRYTNIYQLCPNETRLYGTESLFGDWSGELLLLAQDFCSQSFLQQRIDNCDPRPYRHEPTLRTNSNLLQLTDDIPLGMLYGSALAGLLRANGGNSDRLPSHKHITKHLHDVLQFTTANMPNLKAIACLGRVAWDNTTAALEVQAPDWRVAMESRTPIEADGLLIFAHAHPSRAWTTRGSKVVAIGDWQMMVNTMQSHPLAA